VSADRSRLIPAQRREELVRQLRGDDVLSVRELTQILDVSLMTVRRDINALEREGRVHSVPGGVRLASRVVQEPSFDVKASRDTAEKEAIARTAGKLIQDGMAIYLDAGTTTGALVPFLCEHHGLTVISNDFIIVDRLLGINDMQIIHVGGLVEASNKSTVGRLAAEMLQHINTDMAFISTSSWDLSRGITTPSESKVGVKLAAMQAALSSVLLVTSSKFGILGLYDIAPLERFDRIITDSQLPESVAAGIRDKGVRLDLAS
jgi:DeoR/GlpR family transcriptional regulator of sugar metabolism